jgi:hypothetical protein
MKRTTGQRDWICTRWSWDDQIMLHRAELRYYKQFSTPLELTKQTRTDKTEITKIPACSIQAGIFIIKPKL